MDKEYKIQANKLEYQVPYFEAVEFDYSDIIQTSACSAVCPPVECPQNDGNVDF